MRSPAILRLKKQEHERKRKREREIWSRFAKAAAGKAATRGGTRKRKPAEIILKRRNRLDKEAYRGQKVALARAFLSVSSARFNSLNREIVHAGNARASCHAFFYRARRKKERKGVGRDTERKPTANGKETRRRGLVRSGTLDVHFHFWINDHAHLYKMESK